MPSFDIVNQLNHQEVDNAVNNTLKEISTRYDFKGLHTEVSFSKKTSRIDLLAAESMKLKAVKEMLTRNFIKRGLDPKVLEFGEEEGTSSGAVKQSAVIREGIDRETAKKIVKEIKNTKLKVQPAIMDDQVRVTGKKIDDLQEVIGLLKAKKFSVPLQFINMK
ncbi:YajQ family cyclic di-GMP-binding protein [Natronogracilivirga saccharolytica]|uniref:Nucleotide-binding protein NATSA_12810 n=1 Tax=Natronogracilivirga saccharolytica TaxID=2812953 RepID=A0A8J7RPI5_9BACT|nr:YajQ family cyclic di-GMP-binding protein [Natronogracilivirga saccharolytica]MBP3193549.1 YajQ family cyclic di-GMP-binding protein [Natronogracilivirga saccharolytica]